MTTSALRRNQGSSRNLNDMKIECSDRMPFLRDDGNGVVLTESMLGGVMIAIYMKHPHLLDEAPGLGDLKTAPPRQDGYVSHCKTMKY